MSKRFARFQPHKIAKLKEDVDPTYFDTQLNELYKQIDEFENIESKEVIQSLKNFIVINLVTVMEDTIKRELKFEIDVEQIELKNIFDQNELRIRLTDLDIIKTNEITKGMIVASNFNFQNLNEFDRIFSKAYKVDFLETFLELLKLPLNIERDESQRYYEQRMGILKRWEKLKEIPYERHRIIHNLNQNIELDKEELHDLVDVVHNFLAKFLFFTYVLNMIDNVNFAPKDVKKHLEEEFGNKFEVLEEIVNRQRRKFRN
ncbi:hypothetical protein [Nitrosopumilus sp.]|uniref:hypothetical protein n=1 Tax=Nitrosopumilus sp. TaxID=2024843 RepID=UPI00247D701C|nr:hypothetical protein [Nitrosopumilus sp.]MCV0430718.1 hypothetical protein [Nitrosopumilus sp.]